jgi:DNA-directed RNA polymerase beta' subunit
LGNLEDQAFDGDEMNMHVPQSIVSMNEIADLAGVPSQIISPRECSPILSIEQDVALGVYRMTKKHVMLSEKQLFNMLCSNTMFTGQVPKPMYEKGVIKRWSGRQLLSTIIPKNINIEMANSSYDKDEIDHKDENFVTIRNGEILGGVIDKTVYQSRTTGLIHSIFNEYDPMETKKFFDNTQTLVCDWLVQSGFSVGISDLIVDGKTNQAMKSAIDKMKEQVYDIIHDIHTNKFENTSIKNNHEYFEDKVQGILSRATDEAGKIGISKVNDLYNRMLNMIKSKSKGKITNVGQMIACLGQNSDEGKRIPYGFESRTLPHFTKYDDGPESRGFVENSFISGLSPHEFFFHAIGGRGGLIDTAVKTSDTGYLQRKLVKAMEDCKINYDYTVRNASGSIVQFVYGEDGMDPTKIENQNLPFVKMDYSKLKKTYLLTDEDNLKHVLEADVVDSFANNKGWQEKFAHHFQEILDDREFVMENILAKEQTTKIMYPVSFQRITTNAKAMFNKYDSGVLSDLDPMYVLDTINKLCEDLYVHKHNKANMFLKMLVRCYLSPKKVIFDYKYNRVAFEYVINQVKHRFYDSIAHPSEMVGVVAAQSIGEPATQMSTHKDTIIRVIGKDNFTYSGTIGNFIDSLLFKNENNVVSLGHDSVVMDLDENYKIIGVSDDEKTSWRTISQISRHPANGGLVKVYTKSGKTTTATLTHSFLKRTQNGITEVKGSDLKIGDRVPITRRIPEVHNPLLSIKIGNNDVKLDKMFGWFIGAYLADGRVSSRQINISKVEECFELNIRNFADTYGFEFDTKYYQGQYGPSKDNIIYNNKDLAQFLEKNFGCGSYKKFIGSFVYGCSKEFISGILSGYFDGDGNTNAEKQMIRCGSRCEKLIDDICVLLAYCGIFASKLQEITKRQPGKIMHTLSISKKYANVFAQEIGFNVEEKAFGLQSIIEYNARAEERNTLREEIDMIPELGPLIADIGKELNLPGQSRNYGRWLKKEAIGRRTLGKYIEVFSQANATVKSKNVQDKIQTLIQAYVGDVVWDQIVDLEYIDDPNEYVYDFTVPGNDSFMVDTGVLVHNTLNTFHLSGVASASKAVRGVPRMKELMSVTKNIKTPAMTIFLKDDCNNDDKKSTIVLNNIQTTYFRDIVKSTKVYYDPDDFNTTVDEDKFFVETYRELMNEGLMQKARLYPWLLRFEFDRSAMLERDISMMDVYNIVTEFYEDMVHVMFSDDNSNNLIFRIKIEDNGDERDIITEIKALERSILENLIIKGVSKITKVVKNPTNTAKYERTTMAIESKQEWILETAGTNLLDVLGLKEVDAIRTISNDINEIYELFGVEAARQALYNELQSVINDAGLYVNYRHVALLVDTMTNRGYMLSIDRHGINRADIGPFAKCSFEETTDMLIKAGIFAEVDRINGVSANIMLGQIPPAGTGDSEILIDEWKLQDASADQTATQEEITMAYETFEELNKDVVVDESVLDNLNFDFTLPTIDE